MGANAPKLNFRSHEWAAVEDWLAEELHETYRRLSGLKVDERDTQQLRGRIALLDQMLGFRNETNYTAA